MRDRAIEIEQVQRVAACLGVRIVDDRQQRPHHQLVAAGAAAARSFVSMRAVAPECIDGDENERGAGDHRHRQHAAAGPIGRVPHARGATTGHPPWPLMRRAAGRRKQHATRTSAPTTSSAAPAPKKPPAGSDRRRRCRHQPPARARATGEQQRQRPARRVDGAPIASARRRYSPASRLRSEIAAGSAASTRCRRRRRRRRRPRRRPATAAETCSVSAVVPTASTHQVVSAVIRSEA